jgi:hypothetical protein
MQPEELFDIWAPYDSTWSKWAKPAIFTVPVVPRAEENLSEPSDLYIPHSGLGETAVIVNLPGVESIKYGLALAEQGFQPVPLYNSTNGHSPAINVEPIVSALMNGAMTLSTRNIRPDAPPAFLLDSNRMKGSPQEGDFDNRWVVFPQDFPSGTFLLAHGIKRVMLIQQSSSIDRDLGQVLAFWKRSGIEILLVDGLSGSHPPENLKKISRFNFARAAFGALLIASLGLRRGNAGGFGSRVPVSQRWG